MPLTLEDVQSRVHQIRAAADDDERAHALEDDLHRDVLRYFAETGSQIAIEALKTLDIDFSRWCA
jgi:hypothetical protein